MRNNKKRSMLYTQATLDEVNVHSNKLLQSQKIINLMQKSRKYRKRNWSTIEKQKELNMVLFCYDIQSLPSALYIPNRRICKNQVPSVHNSMFATTYFSNTDSINEKDEF